VRSTLRGKRRWIAASVSVTAALGLVSSLGTVTAAATSGGSSSGSSSSKGGYTIGFSNPQGTQPVLNTFQQALTVAAKRQNITVTSLNANLSVSNQVSDIQQFINQKVKAIVVFPLAGPPLDTVLTKARQAGIIVLGYNALAAYPYNADLDQGLAKEGAPLLANFVLKQLHNKGNVLGVTIGQPVPSLQAFMSANQADVTHGQKNVKWLATVADQTDDIAGAAQPVANALTKYNNKVNAVMAYFDGAAIGAAQSLKTAGVKNAVITGQQGNNDGVGAVKSGEISATLDVMPYNEALIALTMVQQLVNGKSTPGVLYAPVKLITKSNASSYNPWPSEVSKIQSGKSKPPSNLNSYPHSGTSNNGTSGSTSSSSGGGSTSSSGTSSGTSGSGSSKSGSSKSTTSST
jgi:ribose transport system substrate-binding protein